MYCERYHCRLSETACLMRQDFAQGNLKSAASLGLRGDPGCKDCPQGADLRHRHADDAGPTKKKETKPMEAEKTQQCKKCGQPKPLTDGFYKVKGNKTGYDKTCKTCRNTKCEAGKKENRASYRALKNQATAEKNRDTLTLDFSDHPDLLQTIRELAAAELRTPENQVLYWLIKNSERNFDETQRP